MAYRYGERAQYNLLPAYIDEYVGCDDPVQAYDAFVDILDLPALGISLDEEKVGCPQYDPRAKLKVLVYGYSYSADRSPRKLERVTYHNLSFMWLLGGLQPDHKTIANFRGGEERRGQCQGRHQFGQVAGARHSCQDGDQKIGIWSAGSFE